MSATLALAPAARRGHGLMAVYGLLVLIVASIFSAMDRQILVLLGEPMRASLGLSDTLLGLLQGVGVTLFAGLAAVPLGWLADRHGRRQMLAICVLVWAASTAACGLSHSFTTLFISAVGLGIGEAGLAPIVYGLIPEIVPARRRALANGVFALAAIFGAGVGIALSGALVDQLATLRPQLPVALQSMESWRLAFLAVASPGPLVAAAVLLMRRHPERADANAEALPRDDARTALAPFARAHGRTMAGLFIGSGLTGVGLAAAGNWAPIVATRTFGAPPVEVGAGIGAAYLAGTAVGAVLGAGGVRVFGRRLGLATPLRVIAVGSLIAAATSALMLWAPDARTLYWLFGAQIAALIAGSVLAPTMLQDMSPAPLRSRVIAIGSTFAIGMGALSPVLVGALSDWMPAASRGLLTAMAGVGAVAFVAGALTILASEKHFVRTVRIVHPALDKKASLPPRRKP